MYGSSVFQNFCLGRQQVYLIYNRVSSLLRSQINLLFGLRCSKFSQLSWMYISNVALSVSYNMGIWITYDFRLQPHLMYAFENNIPRWVCPVICYEQSIGSDLVYIDLLRLRKGAWKKWYNVYLLIKYSLELKRKPTTSNSHNII